MKKRFKDACDGCGKMDYCKGYGNKVLCPNCIKLEEEKNNEHNDRNNHKS